MVFAGYVAYQAFDAPPIKLGDGPTLPRYMTQPNQYRLGVVTFVSTCLLIYSLIAYFHQELLPIVGAINPELQRFIEKCMTNGSLSYPLVVIFSAAFFVSLLKFESDWNPIFLLRRVVHQWVAIPQIVSAIMIMMRDQLIVPASARSDVVDDSETQFVTISDFDKDRRSLDRHWAELCYIRRWLEGYRAQGSHFTFFNEPSFAWLQLESEFYGARDRVAPLKRGEVTDSKIFEDVAGKVDLLRRQYCRLAACFLVFKNETQKEALRDANQFGVKIALDPPRQNPLHYTSIFFAAIMIAIFFGVLLSALCWDLLHATPVDLSPDIATKWMFFALANYGMPIMVVLMLRYLGWRIDRSQPSSYLASYATIGLVAILVATVCLSIAQTIIAHLFPGQMKIESFDLRLYDNVKWSFSPAIVCIYVIYHIDRQIDPLLPNIGPSEHWGLPQRLMSCLFFGFLVAGVSMLQTLSISGSRSSWPVGKLQIVILGTTLIVGLVIALAGEFLLLPPTTSSEAGSPAPAGIAALTSESRRNWVVTILLGAMLLSGLAVGTYYGPTVGIVPQWSFVNKPMYVGERIPLTWTYEQNGSTASVHFEVESGVAGTFKRAACTAAKHHYVNHINSTRDWRVRAVIDCETFSPVSKWSQTMQVTQYDSIYRRIENKGQVDVVISASQDQDVFKWDDQGVDIALAKLIVHDLSSRMGRELKLKPRSVPWQELLPAADNASADFAISSITQTPQREMRFSIQFTDSYYCTTYALIYRAGAQEDRVRDMIAGKTVGVQRETTSWELVKNLSAGGLFGVKAFDDTESLVNALLASQIDFGVTDTSFAQSAQLDNVNRLSFKELGKNDMPLLQDEPTQQYAIAVHKGEVELLYATDETLTKAKQHGELADLFKTEAEKYEASKNFPPGSRSFGQLPWECLSKTIAGKSNE
jgi:arginine/lysine/histidine transporter system substrate-binding protein